MASLVFPTSNAVASNPCPPAQGLLSIDTLPAGSKIQPCGLAGRTVKFGHYGVVVPPAGESAGAVGLIDGSYQPGFSIAVDPAGVITYSGTTLDGGGFAAASSPETAAALSGNPDACSDDYYKPLGAKWTQTYNWYLGDGPNPAGLSDADIRAQYGASLGNITGQNTDCDAYPEDKVSATAQYQGTTSLESNISSSGNCTAKDGVNVWDAKELPAGTWALTCWHASGWIGTDHMNEADVKFNTVNEDYTTDPSSGCTDQGDIRSIGTHESGHVFGLDDIYGAHANLTMWWGTDPCTIRKRTLGKGDILGLRAYY